MLTSADKRLISTGDTVYIVVDGPQTAMVTDINRKTGVATLRIQGGDYDGSALELSGDRIWAQHRNFDLWLRG